MDVELRWVSVELSDDAKSFFIGDSLTVLSTDGMLCGAERMVELYDTDDLEGGGLLSLGQITMGFGAEKISNILDSNISLASLRMLIKRDRACADGEKGGHHMS